mmetsp:Transcript_80048/g.221319  ORF Transcript_80048/g.221319 Transcript_80048/m.221319 type:complete len:309 (+) Transcript_80048:238-1164(+)
MGLLQLLECTEGFQFRHATPDAPLLSGHLHECNLRWLGELRTSGSNWWSERAGCRSGLSSLGAPVEATTPHSREASGLPLSRLLRARPPAVGRRPAAEHEADDEGRHFDIPLQGDERASSNVALEPVHPAGRPLCPGEEVRQERHQLQERPLDLAEKGLVGTPHECLEPLRPQVVLLHRLVIQPTGAQEVADKREERGHRAAALQRNCVQQCPHAGGEAELQRGERLDAHLQQFRPAQNIRLNTGAHAPGVVRNLCCWTVGRRGRRRCRACDKSISRPRRCRRNASLLHGLHEGGHGGLRWGNQQSLR